MPDGQRSRWAVCGQQRAEQAVVHLGVEDREALPVRGEDVGVGVLDLDDEALELEPAKVVAAAALGVDLSNAKLLETCALPPEPDCTLTLNLTRPLT